MIYYYIMLDPDKPNMCKLGITSNPEQRLRNYKTAAPRCTFVKIYNIPEKRHERKILDIFKDIVSVQREVVHCSPDFAQRIIEGYLTDNNIEYVK